MGKIFVVALVIENPVRGEPQLPVALMLTNSYTNSDYNHFLHTWWCCMLNFNNNVCKPKVVVTDQNWPSIHGIANVFNGCNFVAYLKIAFKILRGKYSSSQIEDFTVLGLGRSHFVHALVCWKEFRSGDARLRNFWTLLLTSMVPMNDWGELKVYFKHVVVILTAGRLLLFTVY